MNDRDVMLALPMECHTDWFVSSFVIENREHVLGINYYIEEITRVGNNPQHRPLINISESINYYKVKVCEEEIWRREILFFEK